MHPGCGSLSFCTLKSLWELKRLSALSIKALLQTNWIIDFGCGVMGKGKKNRVYSATSVFKVSPWGLPRGEPDVLINLPHICPSPDTASKLSRPLWSAACSSCKTSRARKSLPTFPVKPLSLRGPWGSVFGPSRVYFVINLAQLFSSLSLIFDSLTDAFFSYIGSRHPQFLKPQVIIMHRQ